MVAGGGVIGLSCALHIAEEFPNWRIIISDTATRPAVTSRAAAGMLAAYAEFDGDSKLFQLSRQSLEYYPDFMARFHLGTKLYDCGILIPALEGSDEGADENANLASKHAEATWLEGEALRRAEPQLSCRRALRVPGSIVNARLLHDDLVKRACEYGITFHSGRVSSLERNNERIVAATLEDGERIACHHMIIASGSWSQSLGNLAGIDLPVIPVKGQVVSVSAPDGFLRHMIHAHDVYLAPRAGEGVIVGATMEEDTFDEAVLSDVNQQLLALASKYVPAICNLPIRDSWCGFRPKLPDGAPLIAWQGSNLLVATGHYRNGILLAPITGKMVTALIRERS